MQLLMVCRDPVCGAECFSPSKACNACITKELRYASLLFQVQCTYVLNLYLNFVPVNL